MGSALPLRRAAQHAAAGIKLETARRPKRAVPGRRPLGTGIRLRRQPPRTSGRGVQLGFTLAIRIPAFRRSIRRPRAVSFPPSPARASRSAASSRQPPATTSASAECRPPALKGMSVRTTRSLAPSPPAGPRISRALASTSNSFPAGGFRPGYTSARRALAAAASRATASAFSRSRAIVRELGGLFTGSAG